MPVQTVAALSPEPVAVGEFGVTGCTPKRSSWSRCPDASPWLLPASEKARRVSRRFGKHNIIGSEAHQPRPMAYMRKGFVARRPRRPRHPALVLGLAILLVLLLAAWLLT